MHSKDAEGIANSRPLSDCSSRKIPVIICGVEDELQFLFIQNIGGSAKDFGYRSGRYSMELIVGDAVVENPISWPLVSTNRNTLTDVQTYTDTHTGQPQWQSG